MKRKILLALTALSCAFCIPFAAACGQLLGTSKPDHKHTFDMTSWESDAENHWHAATCEHTEEKKDLAPHSFTGDVCLTCGYDKSEHGQSEKVYKKVSFDLGYSTDQTLADKQFEVGKPMTGLPVPERDGYKFICWIERPSGDEYTAVSVMPNRDITLVAEWQKEVGTYQDEYVLFKPATEGYKSFDIYMEYSGEHIDQFVYVEITSDDLGGAQNLGKKENFTLKTIEGMEYRVNAGYTWMWYQNSFDSLNGAQRFTLNYGSNVQLITVLDGGGNLIRTYLLDIYVKHDYKVNLYKSIFDSEPYDTVRVIEGDAFPSDTPAAETLFEFDKRVYMNGETNKYEDFVYSTLIYKNWSLYQTYKPYTLEAELNEGTLDGELQIKPYTQFFTLPSPEKDGYDFLGWQDTNGKYITNVQGYSGAHYVSEEYRPEKLTAVFAEQKHYYEFDGEQLRVFTQSVPVVTYTDKTMETILEIVYVPYGEDCTLPVTAPEYDDAALSGWQYYNYSEGEWATSLTDFDFNRKITSPIALVPKTVGISNAKVIPLNAEKTFNGRGDYKFYLPTAQDYTMEITATGSASFSLKPDGATSAQNYTVSSGSPKTIKVYCYRYNLGAEVRQAGSVLMNVSSLSGSFTVKIIGATATTDGSPVGVYDSQKAVSQNSVSIEAAQKKAYSFSGWYKGEQRITKEFEHSFSLTENAAYTTEWYKLTISSNDTSYGDVSGLSETYKTGERVTITATNKKLAYEFKGWYNGDSLLNKNQEYTFDLPESEINYTARWELLPHLEDFYFTSSATEITITGVKNKTATTLIVPDQVTSIGQKAFESCTAEIKWGDNPSIKEIGISAFYGYKGTSITIPNSITSIGGSAFSGCSNLTSITIPDSVTSLGGSAFYNCTSLESIDIPNSVTSIGGGAFKGCTSLESMTLPFVGNGSDITYFGHLFGASSINDHGKYVPSNLKTIVVTGDKSIGYCAFDYCTSLESITIGNSVTSIGTDAFYRCTGLKEITIGESVTSIGNYAFKGCSRLKSITIPDSVTSIGNDLFGSTVYAFCGALQSVSIGIGVTSFISGSLFDYCPSLGNITVKEGNKAYSSQGGVLYNNAKTELIRVPLTKKDVSISASVTSIGGHAFYGCKNLTEITIPEGVTYIGSEAFYECTNLTEITIPAGVTSIGERVFSGCENLTSVTIPNGVTSIGNYAFEHCTAEITWGNNPSITEIGAYAFARYSGTSITIPNSVTSIGTDAFYYCTAEIKWGDNPSIKEIGISAFYEYKGTSITIPNSITSIGGSAFRECSNLTSITIPDSVTSIGYCAFYNCTSLESVYFNNPNGWYRSSDSSATSGTAIPSQDLQNPETAATYLTSGGHGYGGYSDYYWKRKTV